MATNVVDRLHKDLDKTIGNLPPAIAEAVEQAALTTTYPTGAVLFAEAQIQRGVFIVRRGRV